MGLCKSLKASLSLFGKQRWNQSGRKYSRLREWSEGTAAQSPHTVTTEHGKYLKHKLIFLTDSGSVKAEE